MSAKKVFSRILFFLCLVFVGLVAGALIGSPFVPKDAGLAGGAIVLGYGVLGAVAAVLLGALAVWKMGEAAFRRTFLLVGLLAVAAVGWLAYRYFFVVKPKEEGQRQERPERKFTQTTAPAASLTDQLPVGLGMAKPQLFPPKTLYLYPSPNLGRTPQDTPPTDSIAFRQNERFTDISYAPPHFAPEFLKLDYDMLFLRVVTYSQDWLEVVVNSESGQTAWIDRRAVEWMPWPEFLLSIYSVRPIRPQDFPVRVKPLDHASPMTDPPAQPWQLEAVKGDWLKMNGGGWVRWRNCEGLLVTFEYLS